MRESPNGTTNANGGTAGLTASERHRLFAADRRRLALEILAEEAAPAELTELAAEIAAREHGSDPVDERTVERVAISLHHAHLPKMRDLGVLDYDPEAHRIDPHGVPLDSGRNDRTHD